MKKLLMFFAMFVLVVACGSGGDGSGSGSDPVFNVAGCKAITVNDLPTGIQGDVSSYLNSEFTSYKLQYCIGGDPNPAIELVNYGNNFGDYINDLPVWGDDIMSWWEDGNNGYGFSFMGGTYEYLVIWGSW